MKSSKLKVTIMLSIIMTLGIIAASKVSALTVPAHVGSVSNGYLCLEHEASLDPRTTDNRVTADEINYDGGTPEAMDIIVAYAKYLGYDGMQLQEIIWSSSNNHGMNVPITDAKIINYKTVYDEIFSKVGNEEIIKTKAKSADLKVLVDQIGKTYTVGPYTLNVTVGSQDAAIKLANELKTGDGKFATFNGITGMNAKEGTEIQMIRKDGTVIKDFPDFGEEFYIRFTPANDGAIVATGNPQFNFSFLTNLSGTITRFTATDVKVTINYSDNVSDYIGQAVFPYPGIREESFNGTITQQTQVTVKIKSDINHHNGNKMAETEATKTVTVKRMVKYEKGKPDIYYVPYVENLGATTETKTVTVPHTGNYTTDLQDLATYPDAPTTTTTTVTTEPKVELETEDEEREKEEYDVDGQLIEKPTYADGVPINVQIGGKVWLETPSLKVNEIDGRFDESNKEESLRDVRFKGIQVRLYEQNGGNPIATTLTDSNGVYRFYGAKANSTDVALINPLKKYYVVFYYDGQRYQSTYYNNDLSGGFSNAKDVDRTGYNKTFERIYSNTSNYDKSGWHKAYSLESRIEDNNQNYVTKKGSNDALTYKDVYDKLLEEAANAVGDAGTPKLTDYNKSWSRENDYSKIMDERIQPWLKDTYGITNEYASIKTFIFDTLMTATTKQGNNGLYSTPTTLDRYVIENLEKEKGEYNTASAKTVKLDNTYTYLYYQKWDQARNVDYGLSVRPFNDLALQKDVYKATLLINGKKQEYTYSKKAVDKDSGTWDIKARASDALYNGSEIYRREVRASEYLYDATDEYDEEDDAKNLQVYVTYRIVVKNAGQVNTKVNEIVDYYDPDQFTFVRAYTGNSATDEAYKDNVESSISENQPEGRNSNKEDLKQRNYNYTKLYFTGKGGKALNNDQILAPSNLMYLFVTFKVNNGDYDRVKLDQDIMNGEFKIGKRNIAEINSYSTYYVNGTEIPDRLEGNKAVSTKITNDTTPAGLIDADSIPGSLKNKDLNNEGNIITSETLKDDRQQDDTDKSPNIRLIIDQNNDDIRTLEGAVFEDSRDTKQGEALIGNGELDGKTVNGVTVQLVELVQEVVGDGLDIHSTGKYIGEKVWGSYSYNNSFELSKSLQRYASGADKSRVVMTGPGILEVKANEFEADQGKYSFKSVPAGDFYIRFIYGDTDETVLSNSNNEVTSLINRHGRNEKSYNGQDYKSTVYQAGIAQDGSHNGVQSYKNIETQNYYRMDVIDNQTIYNNDVKKADIYSVGDTNNKDKKYYYNINNSASNSAASDAKDVYDYRLREIAYSKGFENETLQNYRAEVLASHEKVASHKDGEDVAALQANMLEELMNNTYIVAQSGVINTEIEESRVMTVYGRQSLNYVVDHINLGLVERPEAGLKLNKEIDNFNVTLSNGRTLFDVSNNKSVNNLYFSNHEQHYIKYLNDDNNARIERVVVNTNLQPKEGEKKSPELLQLYIDDELMQGATVNVRYKLTVQNIGEVDYNTLGFYYTGKAGNESDKVTTNARKVVDYVSNAIKYDEARQAEDDSTPWDIVQPETLVGQEEVNKNLVNKKFEEEVGTYTTLLTSDKLSANLKPGESSNDIKLILSTIISSNNSADQLVYNNLAEIIATSNTIGRRNVYSIAGNQTMSDQSLGNNAATGLAKEDRVVPQEIDADSAQKIVIMPPTGTNSKTTSFENDIKAIIGTTSLVMIAAYIARRLLLK